ncbi:hypothetical protein SUGI_1114100 [Cryptomeria japonica]|nr:hypothetical protein SUGI_1114100 [Cryptomeria japonica]
MSGITGSAFSPVAAISQQQMYSNSPTAKPALGQLLVITLHRPQVSSYFADWKDMWGNLQEMVFWGVHRIVWEDGT